MDSNYVTQSAVLERGWTKAMLKLLPAPIEKRNPHYKSAAPMKLWTVADVESVENSDAWREMKAKADRRKANAAKAVTTKKAKLEAEIDAALESVNVRRVDLPQLRAMTLNAKLEWKEFHGDYDSDPWTAPDYVVTRWIVNFIRHSLVAYDETLDLWKGKTGISGEYPRFRNGVLTKIATAYADAPEIVEECRNQMIGGTAHA